MAVRIPIFEFFICIFVRVINIFGRHFEDFLVFFNKIFECVVYKNVWEMI